MADRTLEWFESRTSDWKRDPGQSYVYAIVLSQAGRWDQSQAVLEDMFEVVPSVAWDVDQRASVLHDNAALELAYVLARQGHRDQAFRAVGLTKWTTNLVVRAWGEAALGERERAVELLRESGVEFYMHNLAMTNHCDSLLDYPPFQELIRPKG
ncbi:MAG: hypothetical protein IH965_12725 [Gemmatimonadetes bacterium]|nr:hypothetical protein [Gemmatimonadota bacterium]